jgi:EAL domain-containing protein (putative c-di-GMP-specific phosphodiesterase class I)
MEPMATNGSIISQSVLDDCQGDRPASSVSNSATTPLWELRGGLTPNASVQRILVATQPFTIGRDFDSSLCLANPTISRRHAELLLAETDLLVRDLGSRNGTYLNGRRIENFERLQDGDMLQFGAAIFTVHRAGAATMSPLLNEQCLTAVEVDMGDYALANLEFDRLLTDHAVVPHFQPIVRLDNGQRVGYEVLARSRLVGLETPSAMFRVAAERNLEAELSALVRRESLAVAKDMALDLELYVNTHPAELHREGLVDSLRRLREEYPTTAIVLEIHEGAVTSSQSLANLRAQLKDLGMRLAYDDFGAGQSRLMELADVPPDVLKFDMRMIHGLSHASEERQNMVRSLVKIVRSLAVIPLAEGIETGDEAAICRDLGFELAQGYFFGRPTAAPDRSSPKAPRKPLR